MTVQTETIAPADQQDFIGSFWAMLRHLEEDAYDTGSTLDKHYVEAYYRQWNRVTGDNKAPRWVKPLSVVGGN